MNKWLKRIKVKAILPAAVLLAAAAIGTTFAWQEWDLSVTNEMKSHTTGVTVVEEFKPWDYKKVQFENTGSSSVFLRVSYTEHWETPEGQILSNKDSQDREVAIKDFNWDGWEQKSDGWYYYKKVLKSGETTPLVLTKVTYNDSADDVYKNAEYYLYFKSEVVQCSDGSNTLNSGEVNRDATQKVFGRVGTVKANGTVSWD